VHGKSLRPALCIYALPNSIIIDKLDPIQSALTLQGDQPQTPLKSLKFELTTSDYGKALWSLEGPSSSASPTGLAQGRAVKATQNQRIYEIVGHDFQVLAPSTGKWLDFRSLNNVDISSLAYYDELADRYVAWTTEGSLLFVAGDGTPLYAKHLADRLPGFNRLYDTDNSRPPSLIVVPRGDQIALVKP
jgi:hypothetical protein